mgnify:CR=1 FL=1
MAADDGSWSWHIRRNRLVFQSIAGSHWWKMPRGFNPDSTQGDDTCQYDSETIDNSTSEIINETSNQISEQENSTSEIINETSNQTSVIDDNSTIQILECPGCCGETIVVYEDVCPIVDCPECDSSPVSAAIIVRNSLLISVFLAAFAFFIVSRKINT